MVSHGEARCNKHRSTFLRKSDFKRLWLHRDLQFDMLNNIGKDLRDLMWSFLPLLLVFQLNLCQIGWSMIR